MYDIKIQNNSLTYKMLHLPTYDILIVLKVEYKAGYNLTILRRNAQ